MPGPLDLENAIRAGYVKPNLTNFKTKLEPEEEREFLEAVREGILGPHIDPQEVNRLTSDYDYRGWYHARNMGDPTARRGVNANDGMPHFTDKYKTPYHESFSAESQYATPSAPHWNELDQLIDPNTGNIVFDERKRR